MDCKDKVEGDRGIKLLKCLKLFPMSVSSTAAADIWKREGRREGGREGGRREREKEGRKEKEKGGREGGWREETGGTQLGVSPCH